MTEENAQTKHPMPARRRLVLLALSLLVLATASGSIAMISREKVASNVMTFGDLKIAAVINEPDGNGGWTASQSNQIEARYGKAERQVVFKNTGSHPMYVRARVGVSSSTADPGSAQGWDDVAYGMSLLDQMPEQSPAGEKGWVPGLGADGEDGWYYYSQILEPNATTEPLVTSVELEGNFNALVNDGYTFSFDVTGQGVQSEHQVEPATGDLNALTALGWPSDDGATEGAATTTTDTTEITAEGTQE